MKSLRDICEGLLKGQDKMMDDGDALEKTLRLTSDRKSFLKFVDELDKKLNNCLHWDNRIYAYQIKDFNPNSKYVVVYRVEHDLSFRGFDNNKESNYLLYTNKGKGVSDWIFMFGNKHSWVQYPGAFSKLLHPMQQLVKSMDTAKAYELPKEYEWLHDFITNRGK